MWIEINNENERKLIINKLTENNYDRIPFYYILSNPNYIFINFEDKTYKIGCRYPSKIDEENIISFQQLLLLI